MIEKLSLPNLMMKQQKLPVALILVSCPFTASGYVKNCLTGSLYYYKVQWMGKWRYGAGILPALFFVSEH